MVRTALTSITLLALVASVATAQTTAGATQGPENKLTVNGTSNLHEWSCATTAVATTLDLHAPAAGGKDLLPTALKSVSVRIPVKSLKCNHDGMNDNTYKALKADTSPDITFAMAHFEVTSGAVADSFVVHATGSLTIAGQSRTVTLDVTGHRLPNGTVKATGTVPVLMRDYGISPPTAILGTLKTGNEVTITFEITLDPASGPTLPER